MPAANDHDGRDRLSRRTTLARAGGLAAAAALASRGAPAEAAGSAQESALACVLAPEMTEGPYYLPNEKVRRDITEGLPGAPLALRLTVLDASTCKPVKGAAVDIWHASAAGRYSGEAANNTVGRTVSCAGSSAPTPGPRALRDRLPRLVHGRASTST